MILFPPAKINLGLNVPFKREDGYHEIETCMYPIPFLDILEILPAESFSFQQTGIVIPGNDSDNLCVKAYNLMKERFSIPPVYIHLRKEIPMGAGMGGGSADAAYVLKGLNELFELVISEEELEQMAGTLGSDCPFFIKAEPQIAKGRGELLSSCALTLNGFYLKIVNPGIHIGTREAYAGIQFGELSKSIKEIVEGPINDWKDLLKNDFETHIFEIYPSLSTLKNQLYEEGAVYAAMSGSGSTMFGIFKNEPRLTFESTDGFVEKIVRLN